MWIKKMIIVKCILLIIALASAYADDGKDALIREANGYYFKDQDFKKAAETFEKVLVLDPANAVILKYCADSYKRVGNTEQALKYYRKLNEISPDESTMNIIMELQKITTPEEIALVNAYAGVGKDVLIRKANRYYFKDQDFEKAAEIFEKVLKLDPANTVILKYCADSFNRAGNAEQALKYYRKLNEISPDDSTMNLIMELQKTTASKESPKIRNLISAGSVSGVTLTFSYEAGVMDTFGLKLGVCTNFTMIHPKLGFIGEFTVYPESRGLAGWLAGASAINDGYEFAAGINAGYRWIVLSSFTLDFKTGTVYGFKIDSTEKPAFGFISEFNIGTFF